MNQRNDNLGHGIYIYCVFIEKNNQSFEETGVKDKKVKRFSFKDISVLGHYCEKKGYDPEDNEKAKELVFEHNYIVDEAMKKFGNVIPLGFNSIIEGEDQLKSWLDDHYSVLEEKLNKFKEKAEYSVQIFVNKSKLVDDLKDNLSSNVSEDMSKGKKYLQRQKEEKNQKDKIRREIKTLEKDFKNNIRGVVEENKVDESPKFLPEEWENKGELMLNLSCLLSKSKENELGNVLEKIDNKEALHVRFTGPWAPYSFTKMKL